MAGYPAIRYGPNEGTREIATAAEEEPGWYDSPKKVPLDSSTDQTEAFASVTESGRRKRHA